jgi:hypothetical protein
MNETEQIQVLKEEIAILILEVDQLKRDMTMVLTLLAESIG